MQSGIQVDDSCVSSFNDLKTKKTGRYLIMSIEGDTAVKVSSTGDRDKTLADLTAELKADQPAYVVFDFDFDLEGSPRNKMLFVSWIPDTAKIKPKTMYASTKDAVMQKIGGGLVTIQASDYSQISQEAILAKVKSTTRA